MTARKSLAVVLLAALLLSSPATALALTHFNPNLHFKLELPGNWREIPGAEMQQANALVRQRMPGSKVNFLTGFRPADARPGSPYILLGFEAENFDGKSWEDIERELAKGSAVAAKEVKKADGAFSDVIKNTTINSISLDPERNRVVSRMQTEEIGVGKVHGIAVGHLGKDGVLFVYCYAHDVEFNHQLPTFEKINNSFKFDSGYEFVPSNRRKFLKTVVISSFVGGLVGGLAGLALFLVLDQRRRRQWERNAITGTFSE